MERRLAAIVSADVVGYSRLMAEDEDATVRTLAAYRDEIGLLVRQHRGRVVDSPGDNLLAEFSTATEAVACAVEIQGVVKVRNAHFPQDRRMEFRIGVHLGEVRLEAERLHGDGVNIAARLQALAEPGGICVSRAVHEQVGKKLAVSYANLGPQSLKNIPEPVQAYSVRSEEATSSTARPRRVSRQALAALVGAALIAVAVVAFLTFGGGPPKESGPPLTSIAVLPFDDMSPGGDQKWLADGMAEELIETLSRIEALRVLARTSAFAMKGKDIATVGEALRVGSVVEGSVRRSDDQLRVTAQLIRVSDGSHLWSARYDRKLSDVFAIQSEIARAIAEAVRQELEIEYEFSRARSDEPSDVRAYELVRKGFDAMWSGGWPTEAGIRKGIEYDEQALAIDPDYATAYAELGNAYLYLWDFSGRAESDLATARGWAERALASEATNGSAHAVLVEVLYRSEYQWQEARRVVNRGLAHNPGHSELRAHSAQLLAYQGQTAEAVVEMRRASDLDPWFWLWHFGLGVLHVFAAQHEAGIEELERAWALAPGVPRLRTALAYAYHLNGREEEALQAAVREFPAEFAGLEAAIRRGFEEGGYAGMVRSDVEWHIANNREPCAEANGADGAGALALMGQADAMFECLQTAIDRRDAVFLKVNPLYDPYRSDPRFTALLRRMNLAE